MAYYASLVFDHVGIKLGQGLDKVMVQSMVWRLEVDLSTNVPVDLDIANRIEAFYNGHVLRSAAGE